MHNNINELREIESIHIRAARNLLAEKGAQRWTPSDQAQYDRHLDAAELARDQRDRVDAQRYGVEIFLRKSYNDYSPAEARVVKNTMSTTGTQGGYTVPTRVAAEFVLNLKGTDGIRQAATQIVTATGGDLSYPTSDGTAEVGELIAQNTFSTAVDTSFGTAPLTTYKFSSKTINTPMELVQDAAFDFTQYIYQRAAERIGRAQNALFTTGTGTGQPTKLLTAASVGKVGTTGQTLTIIYDDLVDMADSVDYANHKKGAGWMMSPFMRKMVRRIKDTSGRPIWTPSFDSGFKADTPDSLLGYPVYINNDFPVPAANAKTLAFGNLASYLVRDALEVTLFRLEDQAYVKLGQVGFLAWARAGGNLLDTQAVRLYQHSAT